MGRPLFATKIVSEWDQITIILVEEVPQITKYGNSMKLIRMDERIGYSFYNLNSIYNNDNICNILDLSYSTNTTSNGEKFSFGW